jgi:hypothetical protein
MDSEVAELIATNQSTADLKGGSTDPMNKEEGGDRQLLEEGIAYNAEDEMV